MLNTKRETGIAAITIIVVVVYTLNISAVRAYRLTAILYFNLYLITYLVRLRARRTRRGFSLGSPLFLGLPFGSPLGLAQQISPESVSTDPVGLFLSGFLGGQDSPAATPSRLCFYLQESSATYRLSAVLVWGSPGASHLLGYFAEDKDTKLFRVTLIVCIILISITRSPAQWPVHSRRRPPLARPRRFL